MRIFDNAESVFINNKEVQSIVLADSGGVLYEKQMSEPLVFTFSGKRLTQNATGSFNGTNMKIDYGDGTIESTTGKFGHTYSEHTTYQVKIYGVTSLGDYCFDGCYSLISITIPSSITSLGDACFRESGLTSITIPDSITNLGDSCFEYCTILTSITLDWTGTDILTYNSNWITDANSNLIFEIPKGTKQLYIDKGYPADKLQEPPMILTVTGSSFSTARSTALTYNDKLFIDWGDNTGLVEYDGDIFSHTFNDGLNSHTVKVYGDLISLDSSCFYNCTGLTSITLPYGVTYLGAECFSGCTGLTSVVIPNSVTDLGEICFENCTGLTSITLPDSITYLGYGCFRGCSGLTSITIPSSVSNLEDDCFYGCTGLTDYYLNWTSSSTIITYNSNTMPNNTNTIFHVPAGTKQLYISKGYPENKLEELLA